MINTNISQNNIFYDLYNDLSLLCENSKNYIIKNVKKITAPLSSSKPLALITKLANKTLALANSLRSEPFVPLLGRVLEDFGSVLSLGSFVGTLAGLFPSVGNDNLDESELASSVGDATKITLSRVRVKRRRYNLSRVNEAIVNRVKNCLEKTHTDQAIRADLQAFLIDKGIDQAFAARIAGAIRIQQKEKPLIEKIYSTLYLVPGVAGVLGTLDKWGIISLAKLAMKIGNIPVFGTLAKIGLKRIASYFFLGATTLRFGYNIYKLLNVQIKVWEAKEGSREHKKAIEERTEELWATFLCGLNLVGVVVPLILTVNPPMLIAYEIFVAALTLANELS